MTPDQLRRSIRSELHAARCRDADHGEARLWQDARELDRRMAAAGHSQQHATSWGTSPTIIARRNERRDAPRGGESTIGHSDDADVAEARP